MNTKILATIGPKCEDAATIEKMIAAGMDIARVNFSHASYEQFTRVQRDVANAARKLKKDVKVFFDLQGPRIRVGKLPAEGIHIEEQKVYTFQYFSSGYTGGVIPIDDPYLHLDVKPGEPFFLANGALELEVVRVKNEQITARCLKSGMLFSRKGINIPQTNYQRGALTRKDIADAKFGLSKNAEYFGLSFVQCADDVLKLRKIAGKHPIKIISKIERAIALKNIDEIIQVSDGIVVARGDLGIETPMEDLPIVQKDLIRHARWHDKPVIVATQMLLSMIDHPHPTRAEVSDIANAVFERADAVWLSDETANGNYPVECVQVMKKIITRIDRFLHQENLLDVIFSKKGTKK